MNWRVMLSRQRSQCMAPASPTTKPKRIRTKDHLQYLNLTQPAALVLRPGHFQESDGDDVSQISFASIEAEAHGIAVATGEQSIQWSQQHTSISSHALAILLLEELPREQLDKFQASRVSFPATYKGTEEPVLVFGTMKNLGDQPVHRDMASNVTQIDIVDNIACGAHPCLPR